MNALRSSLHLLGLVTVGLHLWFWWQVLGRRRHPAGSVLVLVLTATLLESVGGLLITNFFPLPVGSPPSLWLILPRVLVRISSLAAFGTAWWRYRRL